MPTNDNFSFKVEGMDELQRRMLQLPESIARTIGEESVGAGLDVIKDAAVENAPELTGKLKRGIKRKVGSNLDAKRAYKEDLVIEGSVYVSKSAEAEARWNEFGTAPHVIKAHGTTLDINGEPVGKTVQHPGQPARPFMRPAYDNNKEKAVEAMADRMRLKLGIAVEDTKR